MKRSYAPVLVRCGIGLVFLVFGIWQWIDPAAWYGYLPPSLPFGWAQNTAVLLNGTFDCMIGLLLILGLLTRVAAVLGALHVFGLALMLGVSDVSVRDAGIGIVLLGVALYGPDELCLDRKLRWKLFR
jgi:uncharacterized membrane protein YphA (DoxX/SURF4 family)